MTNPIVATASTRSGTITVTATEQGIPTSIEIDPSELLRAPGLLAKRLTDLCKQAGTRAGYERRRQLAAAGVDATVLSYLRLPTAEDVRDADRAAADD